MVAREHETIKYRADIDGLRAVSVLAVLLFHFGLSPLGGGYNGVDIFFVISGFLISSILVKDLSAGRFSILDFYSRRIRRIVPALGFVLIVTVILGYFFLLPADYKSLALSAVSSAVGVANFYFLKNTDYFDQQGEMLPLLHMWSLGVEEQFYLLWPVLLWIVWRYFRARIVFFVTGLLLMSFALAIWTSHVNGQIAFYSPHTRAWELTCGALLIFIPACSSRAWANFAGCLGFLAIGYSFFALSAATPSPGLYTLIPVVGACLVIWSGVQAGWTARILAVPPLVFVGKISYSLYLWHWPVLVYFRYYNNSRNPDFVESTVLFIVSILLATFSWAFVEKPFRKSTNHRWRSVVVGIGFLAALVLMFSKIYVDQGLPQRPLLGRDFEVADDMWTWACPEMIQLNGIDKKLCRFGQGWTEARHRILILGDSHSEHLLPVMAASKLARQTAFVVYRACVPMVGSVVQALQPGHPEAYAECPRVQAEVREVLRAHPEIDSVFLMGQWNTHLPRFYEPGRTVDARRASQLRLLRLGTENFVSQISRPSLKIVLLGGTPDFGFNAFSCVAWDRTPLVRRPCELRLIARAQYLKNHADVNLIFKTIADKTDNVLFLNPSDGLCESHLCLARVNGEFLFFNSNHFRRDLSEETNARLAEILGFNGFSLD